MNEKQIDDEFARMQRVATRVIRWWNIECAKGQQSETPESVYLAQAFLKYGAVRPEARLPETSQEVHDMLIDAERYRWLRNDSANQYEHPIAVEQHRVERGMQYIGPMLGERLDKAIDAARLQLPQDG